MSNTRWYGVTLPIRGQVYVQVEVPVGTSRDDIIDLAMSKAATADLEEWEFEDDEQTGREPEVDRIKAPRPKKS